MVDLLLDLDLGTLADLEAERDVVAHGQMLERRIVLEDEADTAPLRRDVRHVAPVDRDGAGVGQVQAGDGPQQGRLARAAGAQQRGQRAGRHLEVDVVQRREVAVVLVRTLTMIALVISLVSLCLLARARAAGIEDQLNDQYDHRDRHQQRGHGVGTIFIAAVIPVRDQQCESLRLPGSSKTP